MVRGLESKEVSRAKENRSKETSRPSRNINNGYRGCPDADTQLSLHNYNTRFSEIGSFNIIFYSWCKNLEQYSSKYLELEDVPRRYHLRAAEGFNVPKYNYSIGRTSLSYRGPIAWNILPEPYELIDSWASFKQKIKKDPALLAKLSFEKESCLSTNKNDDFYYF